MKNGPGNSGVSEEEKVLSSKLSEDLREAQAGWRDRVGGFDLHFARPNAEPLPQSIFNHSPPPEWREDSPCRSLIQRRTILLLDAERFVSWWYDQNKKNPDAFPFQMSDGEWARQFWEWQRNDQLGTAGVQDGNLSRPGAGAELAGLFEALTLMASGNDDLSIQEETGISADTIHLLRTTAASFTKQLRFTIGRKRLKRSDMEAMENSESVLLKKISRNGWERLINHALVEPPALGKLLGHAPIHPMEVQSIITVNGQLVVDWSHEKRLVGAVLEMFAVPPTQYTIVIRGYPDGDYSGGDWDETLDNGYEAFCEDLSAFGILGSPVRHTGHAQPYQLEAKIIREYGNEEGGYFAEDYAAILVDRQKNQVISSRYELIVALIATVTLHLTRAPTLGYMCRLEGHVSYDDAQGVGD